MSSSAHRIRWKGRTEGPYTREDIRTRLAAGELSLLHRVEVAGRWTSLGEFLSPAPARVSVGTVAGNVPAGLRAIHAPIPVAHAESEKAGAGTSPENIGYFLCGLSFLLPVLATIPAVVVALRLRREGDAEGARAQLLLLGLLTALGLGFWLTVSFAYARGAI